MSCTDGDWGEALPEHVWQAVLRYLGPECLLRVSEVSRKLHTLALAASLWKPICAARFEGWQQCGLDDGTEGTVVVLHGLLQESKNGLMGVREAELVGKDGSPRVAVRLADGTRLSVRPHNISRRSCGGTTVPWHRRYKAVELDAARKGLTPEELSLLSWRFDFR